MWSKNGAYRRIGIRERSKMTLDDAIKLLTENYKIAQKHEFIAKPLSWALYHTWDEIDKKEKRRNLSNGQRKEHSQI